MCSFCVCLCGWTCSLCLSALPSNRAPDEVIRTVTGVARLHCLYLAGVSVMRCQIVVLLLWCTYSLCQSRVSVYPCRVRTGLYSLPELETLHCRVYCTCTADDICTSTVFGVCTCTASLSHLHCVLELSNKDSVFTRNWISSFLYRDRRSHSHYLQMCKNTKHHPRWQALLCRQNNTIIKLRGPGAPCPTIT